MSDSISHKNIVCPFCSLHCDDINLEINDRKISSGLRKFGAILGENCQLGCNSVTNPGTILGVGCSVLPNVTVTGCHGKNSQLR